MNNSTENKRPFNLNNVQGATNQHQNNQLALFPQNKMWCDVCRKAFSCSNARVLQRACPNCQNIGHSLLNTNNIRPVSPFSSRLSGYIRPITRPSLPFQPSLRNIPALPDSNTTITPPPSQDQNMAETFTVTFLRRTMRRPDGTVVHDSFIPIVQLQPSDHPELLSAAENHINQQNSEQTTQQNSDESSLPNINNGSQPSQSDISAQISRISLLTQIINRLSMRTQNFAPTEDSDETNWSSLMDESHNTGNRETSNNLPFIIFVIGSTSSPNSAGIRELVENFFLSRSEGKAPASEEAINRLQNFKFGDPSISGTHDECAICQSDYSLEDDLVKLPCTHDYHKECVLKWLHQNDSCPVCRRSIEITTSSN